MRGPRPHDVKRCLDGKTASSGFTRAKAQRPSILSYVMVDWVFYGISAVMRSRWIAILWGQTIADGNGYQLTLVGITLKKTIGILIRCQHESAPMHMKENALAGLSIVGFIDTHGDVATCLSGRYGGTEGFRQIDRLRPTESAPCHASVGNFQSRLPTIAGLW